MKRETAINAAAWWADQLRTPAKLKADGFSTKAHTWALWTSEKEHEGLTKEKIDAFQYELEALIVEKEPTRIDTDYHPCLILRDAASKAGIDLGMTTLPWKMTMWIEDDRIEVSQ